MLPILPILPMLTANIDNVDNAANAYNVAVDNILEKLTQPGDKTNKEKLPILRTVRLGHPARIKPSIAKHGLEALVKSSDGTEIVDDVRRELESHLRSLSKDNRKPIPNPNQTPRIKNYKQPKRQQGNQRKLDKRSVYKEIKLLRKEIRHREEKVVSRLVVSLCINFGQHYPTL